MNDKAQMMVLESIIFAITTIIAISFLINLSPSSIQRATETTTNLKTIGDDALNTIFANQTTIQSKGMSAYNGKETYDPTSKLQVCVITNNYEELTASINRLLPTNVFYNIYIADSEGKKVFWCNSTCTSTNGWKVGDELTPIGTVFTSHHIISIDPVHLTMYTNPISCYMHCPPIDPQQCHLKNKFQDKYSGYTFSGATYDFIMEMWRT